MKHLLVLGALAVAATSLAGCATDDHRGSQYWRHHHHSDGDHDHDHDGDHHWNDGYNH